MEEADKGLKWASDTGPPLPRGVEGKDRRSLQRPTTAAFLGSRPPPPPVQPSSSRPPPTDTRPAPRHGDSRPLLAPSAGRRRRLSSASPRRAGFPPCRVGPQPPHARPRRASAAPDRARRVGARPHSPTGRRGVGAGPGYAAHEDDTLRGGPARGAEGKGGKEVRRAKGGGSMAAVQVASLGGWVRLALPVPRPFLGAPEGLKRPTRETWNASEEGEDERSTGTTVGRSEPTGQ